MARLERIYRRTDSGLKALLTQDAALSEEKRRILGLIEGEMHWDVMRTLLRRHADYQTLADLESGGLVVSEAASSGSDLDFTGSFVFQKAAEAT